MGIDLKIYKPIARKAIRQVEDLSLKAGSILEDKKDDLVEKSNQAAARKYAISLNLVPIHNPEVDIRRQLNEKIIQLVKSKRLKHIDMAIAGRTARTRITAIMNRRLHTVTIDAMIQLLGVLGTSIEIKMTDS